jgi:hypothetical protein
MFVQALNNVHLTSNKCLITEYIEAALHILKRLIEHTTLTQIPQMYDD